MIICPNCDSKTDREPYCGELHCTLCGELIKV